MLLYGFSYTTCDFATNNTEKNTKYPKPSKKKHWIVKITDIFPPSLKRRYKKSRIGLLHRNQFAEGIQLTWTIISKIYRKKKICKKALSLQLSIAYLCDTNNESRSYLFQNATLFNTRCTQHFWMTSKNCFRSATTRQPPKQSFLSQSCPSQREEIQNASE
jgi:hypothetical protein